MEQFCFSLSSQQKITAAILKKDFFSLSFFFLSVTQQRQLLFVVLKKTTTTHELFSLFNTIQKWFDFCCCFFCQFGGAVCCLLWCERKERENEWLWHPESGELRPDQPTNIILCCNNRKRRKKKKKEKEEGAEEQKKNNNNKNFGKKQTFFLFEQNLLHFVFCLPFLLLLDFPTTIVKTSIPSTAARYHPLSFTLAEPIHHQFHDRRGLLASLLVPHRVWLPNLRHSNGRDQKREGLGRGAREGPNGFAICGLWIVVWIAFGWLDWIWIEFGLNLDWIGLDWIRLDCIQLYWIGLDCIVLYCIVLYWIVLYWIVLDWIVLYCIVGWIGGIGL